MFTHIIRSHAPHGACGLKSQTYAKSVESHMSRPTRGVWIEIDRERNLPLRNQVTPHTGRVD